jgi:hypothetical protein
MTPEQLDERTRHLSEKARGIAQRESVRWAGIAVYGLVTVGLAWGGILLILHLLQQPRNKCPDTSNLLPDPAMILVGLGAILLGRFLGHLRYRDSWEKTDVGARRASSSLGRVAFLLFLGLCTFALIYEALGEQQITVSPTPSFPGLAPITEYSRCAVYYDKLGGGPGWTVYAVVIALCTLVGHWLWSYHPPRDFGDQDGGSTPTGQGRGVDAATAEPVVQPQGGHA